MAGLDGGLPPAALKAISDASADTLWVPARRLGVNLIKADARLTIDDEKALLSALDDLKVMPASFPIQVAAEIWQQLTAPVTAGNKSPLTAARDAQPVVQTALDTAF